MAWRDSPEAAVAAVAALDPQVLARRLTAAKLAVLARALLVRSTGPKALVAAGVVARADILERMLRLGDDPVALARTFKHDSLVAYVTALGGFTGLNKYGLAATLIGRHDTICRWYVELVYLVRDATLKGGKSCPKWILSLLGTREAGYIQEHRDGSSRRRRAQSNSLAQVKNTPRGTVNGSSPSLFAHADTKSTAARALP